MDGDHKPLPVQQQQQEQQHGANSVTNSPPLSNVQQQQQEDIQMSMAIAGLQAAKLSMPLPPLSNGHPQTQSQTQQQQHTLGNLPPLPLSPTGPHHAHTHPHGRMSQPGSAATSPPSLASSSFRFSPTFSNTNGSSDLPQMPAQQYPSQTQTQFTQLLSTGNGTSTQGRESVSSVSEPVASGYATPQSQSNNINPSFVDFPPSMNGGGTGNSSGDPQGNDTTANQEHMYSILDLAARLEQSAMFLRQAVQEGNESNMIVGVDHVHALVQPHRSGRQQQQHHPMFHHDAMSSPGSTSSSSIPLNPPMSAGIPGLVSGNSNGTRSTKSPEDAVGRDQQSAAQQLMGSRPPSPLSRLAQGHTMLGLGLGLDSNAEATRKRCASAVTDGDRIIKSLKRENLDFDFDENQPPSQQSGQPQQQQMLSLPPPPLQMHPHPHQIQVPHTPTSMGPPSAFITPLTPSTDPFFSPHGTMGHMPPLTPVSAVGGNQAPQQQQQPQQGFYMPSSNPPSAPASRPTSPVQHHVHAIRRVPSMMQPTMVSPFGSPFSMEHRSHPNGMSWPDMSALSSSVMQTQAMAFQPPQHPPPPSLAESGFVSPARSTFSSPNVSAKATPLRVRPSRSSSYSRVVDTNGSSNTFTPSLKHEEHENDFYPSHNAKFSMSAPDSPHSTTSDDSLDWPHPIAPSQSGTSYHYHQNSTDADLYAQVNHIPNPNYPGSEIPMEFKGEVERVFFEFMNRICSNLEATDAKGEPIHQTLMAKKMQRLDESPDFRPFKFRIQAFTNAFLEELAKQGYPEDKIPMKKIRGYLWIQPFISRYNEDGKKSKSKGNHIWNIDAKKNPEGGWIFRKFQRKIAGSPPGVAYEGLPWSYRPHIWDPQQSRRNDTVQYSSPWLPPWLSWEGDTLSGTPPEESQGVDITVEAMFQENNEPVLLTSTFHLAIAPLNAGDVNTMNTLGLRLRPSLSGDNGLTRRMNSDSLVSSMTGGTIRPPLPRQTTTTNIPPSAGPSRVVEVLNDTKDRVLQSQTVASLSFADPQLHASLARQHQVLTAATTAIENSLPLDQPVDIQTSTIANVGTQFVAATVEALQQERRPFPAFPPVGGEANITVSDVSAVTADAIAQAVNSLPPSSTEVELLMAAKSVVETTRGPNAITESSIMMNTDYPMQPELAYPSGPTGTLLPAPQS